ncbi:MAG: SCO family protein [Chitinophagaceae bacterium]|nr:SCO family protein [Chitinophagaceae bacterium]MCW5904697.1 SCO family protein [Chitinophagaceae bacterium]
MGKKSIPALMIALLIPIMGYLFLRTIGEKAVIMPKKYFYDSVSTKEVDGKLVTDTVWHRTANFRLVNQLGDTVELYDIKGKAIVIDIFFTRCGSICPQLTKSMSNLQQIFKRGGNTRSMVVDTSVVQFISLSIDPERDSVSVLKHYADIHGVNPDNWWLLTGNRDTIYDFIFNELKIDKLEKEPISPEFPHTGRFVLLDKNYIVRGRLEQAYSGIQKDSASMKVLARDIGLLVLEKDKKQRNKVLSAIIDLGWLWLVIVVLITGFIWYIKQKRNTEDSI